MKSQDKLSFEYSAIWVSNILPWIGRGGGAERGTNIYTQGRFGSLGWQMPPTCDRRVFNLMKYCIPCPDTFGDFDTVDVYYIYYSNFIVIATLWCFQMSFMTLIFTSTWGYSKWWPKNHRNLRRSILWIPPWNSSLHQNVVTYCQKYLLDSFKVIFSGLYHGKSSFFTTIWEHLFFCLKHLRQIQLLGLFS